MRKFLFAFIVILASFIMVLVPVSVLADEDTEEPVIDETTEETGNENETENEVETDPTLDDFKNEVQAWMSQYMEESLVVKIITWLVDAGVLSALFVVYLKYRKHKSMTIEELLNEYKVKMGEWLKENFDKLSEEQIDKIKDSINSLEQSNETIMKVLVLMQDNTAKGKATLIEYLGSKTNNKEVKEAATEVSQILEEQEKATLEVKNKVAGDYEKIF